MKLLTRIILNKYHYHNIKSLFYTGIPTYWNVQYYCTNGTQVENPAKFTQPLYIQGQYANGNKKNREYFYYIDHQGMLFLDDSKMKNFTSCFKDKIFLRFFFKQLKFNATDSYPQFPFLSLCGRERNFIRCDDLPLVFTHIIEKESKLLLSYGYAGDHLTVAFEPSKLCMLMSTGRIYHPGLEKMGGVGLIRSKLALQIASKFVFENGEENPPTKFSWNNQCYDLTQELVPVLQSLDCRKFSLGIDDT